MEPPRRKVFAVVVLLLLGGLLVVGAVFLTRHPGAALALVGYEDDGKALGNESKEGTMPATLVVAGQAYSTGIGSVGLDAPAGTARVSVVVVWFFPLPQSAPTLRAVLEQRVDGDWRSLEQDEGQFVGLMVHSGDLSEAELRVRLEPAQDGAYSEQDFQVEAEYWS